MNINFSLLKELTSIYGPSSREEIVAKYIENEVKAYVDEISTDPLGNLIVRKKGKGNKIMVSAHMDQIGLMVTDIDEDGFIRFTNVGGLSPSLIQNQRFIFENGIIGVANYEPVEDKAKTKLSNMYLDIGILDGEKVKEKVQIGDICVYHSEFIETDDVVTSNYLDDRVGCFILIEAIKNVKETDNDLYFVFSVQEEVGLRGAKTASYGIKPDYGLAVDVTATGDTPEDDRMALKLGNGAAIKVKDNSVMTHLKVRTALMDLASDNNIKYQLEVLEYGGTDAGAIHTSRKGTPTGAISIPCRYIHSSVETASKEDIIACIDLLVAFVEHEM